MSAIKQMKFAIQVNSTGLITAQYSGLETLGSPWIELSREQFTQIVPGSTWNGSAILLPASPTAAELLASAQVAQNGALAAACRKEITCGFTSSALGAPNTYSSAPTAQANLVADAQAAVSAPVGWSTPIWCANAGGTWAFVQHSAAQVAQVLADFHAMRAAAQTKLAALKASVAAETTLAAVQAITW